MHALNDRESGSRNSRMEGDCDDCGRDGAVAPVPQAISRGDTPALRRVSGAWSRGKIEGQTARSRHGKTHAHSNTRPIWNAPCDCHFRSDRYSACCVLFAIHKLSRAIEGLEGRGACGATRTGASHTSTANFGSGTHRRAGASFRGGGDSRGRARLRRLAPIRTFLLHLFPGI